MNLSKTKYCNGVQCKKILWLDKYKKEEKDIDDNEKIKDNGTKIHEIAKNLFDKYINITYNDDLNIMIKDTHEALKEDYIVITEASFVYNNNFASIDILKKNKNDYEIYEVKGSTHLKENFIDDISYQYYILNNLGLNVTKSYIVYLNNQYERNGELDLKELFIKKDVSDIVRKKQSEVKENIKQINLFVENKNEKEDMVGENCFKPYKCPYFKYCTKHLANNNIFNLPNMRIKQKVELYKKGNYSYEKLLNENINENYKRIIEYELFDKKDYIDKNGIKKFLDTLTYPLYFLDFETYQMPIPYYDNVSPYQQIPFQYSLHYIEEKGGKLYHKEFLSETGVDPRRMLAERLVEDIPKNVCTLAYNMGFEKSVIMNLAKIYPDLSEHLINIHDNIKDLRIPFLKGYYYNKNMHGLTTIKYVLPALFPNDSELNYKNLDLIHNGGDAMDAFSTLHQKTKEEQKYIRERLLKYCELDTFAMVKIYNKLCEVIDQKIL